MSTKPPWYADGLRFECTRCGNCCGGAPGYVWVDADESRAIAQFLALTPAEFARRHTRKVSRGRSLKELPDGDCEFLQRNEDGTSGCRIHPVRPLQCRTWPFWKSNLRSAKSWEATGRECPGIDHGPLHALPVIQSQMYEGASRPL